MAVSDPLFQSVRVRNTVIANRFAMPAMQIGDVDNYIPTEGMVDHLRGRAEGGVGLIISESVFPDHPSAYWIPQGCVLMPDARDAWSRVVSGVKDAGSVMLLQLMHAGAIRDGPMNTEEGHLSLSPSGLAKPGRPNGRAMTLDDIREVKAAFVNAARMALEVGADGIELHCAHGYLLDQFLWSGTNLRTDEYSGKSLAERARFPAEIVEAIRSELPEDFIIAVKFSQWKELDYGARIAESPEELGPFLARMRGAGADLFDVSCRRYDAPQWPDLHPTRSLAAWTKLLTDAPVMALGSVGLSTDVAADLFDGENPELQLEADLDRIREGLRSGQFDMIGVGRMLLANSSFVANIKSGDLSGIIRFEKKVHLARLLAGLDDLGDIQQDPASA